MNIKSLIFDEDDKPKAAAPVATIPHVYQPQPAPNPVANTLVSGTAASSSMAYETLRAKTDFDSTDVGQIVAKYSRPLITVLTDEKLRCKAAAAQAANEGVSKEKILATFDGLKVTLDGENQAFLASANSQENTGITQKQQEIRELSSQMSEIQHQITALGRDVSDAQSHINKVKFDFNAAYSRRLRELENEKSHYVDMLA